jgi:hypothetical protein
MRGKNTICFAATVFLGHSFVVQFDSNLVIFWSINREYGLFIFSFFLSFPLHMHVQFISMLSTRTFRCPNLSATYRSSLLTIRSYFLSSPLFFHAL